MTSFRTALVFWLFCCLSPCFAQDPPSSDGGLDEATLSREALRRFQERGLSFHTQFVNDWSKNLRPDYDSGYGWSRYSFDVSATLDSEKSLGWKGGTGFARLKQHLHEFGWSTDQAAQLYSNIDAASRTTLYELWYEQKWLAGNIRVKGGKIDANTEFATVENAGDFLNSSMGFSPTILTFPTYPEPKPGALVSLAAMHGYGISLGVFQAAAGTMTLAEPRRHWSLGESELAGHFSAGYWRLDGAMPCFDGRMSPVNQGFYSVVEQGLWRSKTTDRHQAFSAFFQFGRSNGDVSPFTQHIGGGAIWQAPFAARPQDGLGAAATWVKFSPMAGYDYSGEWITEGYYKVILNAHLAVLPDAQFLHHPGGLRAHPDVVVFTPRVVISF